MNGNGAFPFVFVILILETVNAPFVPSMTRIASSSFFKDAFLPSTFASLAVNFLFFFLNSASTSQYSSGINALISFSFSTINFKATDCTRPADFDLILLFNSFESLKPMIRSRIRRVS